MAQFTDETKHPICRQRDFLIDGQIIIWSHWRNTNITRRVGEDGQDEIVGHQPITRVNHETYEQFMQFYGFIARYEFQLDYWDAVIQGLVPRRPETIAERQERKRNWWEKHGKTRAGKEQKAYEKELAAGTIEVSETQDESADNDDLYGSLDEVPF